MHFFKFWILTKTILQEAYRNAFCSTAFKIIRKTTDSMTGKAEFSLKIRKVPTEINLSTQTIMFNDHYLFGLSSDDRKQIIQQYLSELKQPLAYIEEYPLLLGDPACVFKIFLVSERKIVCGTATDLQKRPDLLSLLSIKDVIKIAQTSYMECFEKDEKKDLLLSDNNIFYLK